MLLLVTSRYITKDLSALLFSKLTLKSLPLGSFVSQSRFALEVVKAVIDAVGASDKVRHVLQAVLHHACCLTGSSIHPHIL